MPKESKYILIVEDEKSMAEALDLKLTKAGLRHKVVSDGEAAMRALEEDTFDAILLDVIMPKVDGFAVLEFRKKSEVKTPVIVLTNLSNPEDETRAKALGAAGYLVKSNTTLDEIVKQIKQLI